MFTSVSSALGRLRLEDSHELQAGSIQRDPLLGGREGGKVGGLV